ncbi:Lin0512 family protein [Actibacterium sp. 188UL27-1]|uniref:Lin0512 family protein n=1 Tax=Actibacterium sp. 188UL27-1 TaxID=2786961 RepID=UPI00195D3CF0|nr:Lin0512 family protein [Actibacterium sp. 188UL27-1]MBM7069056.1 Lin0512 family protein [Actibacterium sp. 188UL27-1]
MTDQRFIIEMGMGNDLYGQDQTKAATRAIEDAMRHSSIPLFESLGISHDEMRLQVTIGIPDPDSVDIPTLTATLPRGKATVRAVKGGLYITNPNTGNVTVVASAAIEAFLPPQSQ